MGQSQIPTAAEKQILALESVLQSLRDEDDVDALINTTISYIQEQFDYSLIWIALYDRLKHKLFGRGGIIPGGDTIFFKKQVVLNSGDLLEQVVIEQRPLGVADLQAEVRAAEWQEFGKKFNIQGTIFLPIRYKDRCLGVLLLGSERWGYLLQGEAKARLMIVIGELGAVLHQREMELQQKQAKRPDEQLLKLLHNLSTLNNFEHKIKAVVETTHKFVLPSRTNVYWFDRQGGFFWCRMSNQLVSIGRDDTIPQPAAGMTLQELSELYYALSVNQIVWIGDARSSLKSHFTGKLLQRLRVRSLLAAPIMWQKDLLGFLAVEHYEAQIWTETDKNFVQGAAGLLSLTAPYDTIETTIKTIQHDTQLTSQIAQAIYSQHDLHETLRNCATKILARLGGVRFLLLQYDSDQHNYQILYQSQPHNRRPFTFALAALKDMDGQMLKSATTAVDVDNLEEDLRFFNWRPPLSENGVRSLLVANCNKGHNPTALLLLTYETRRTWTTLEKDLLWVVSQQIGVIVRQWQLHQDTEEQQKILDSLLQCLQVIEAAETGKTVTEENLLERTALAAIASVIGCPLALLLSWSPGENLAKIIPGLITDSRFGVVTDAEIPIQTEALIQWTLSQDGYLSVNVDDLPPETRKWLNGSSIGQILVIVLRTAADYEPTGVVLLADHRERHWSQTSLKAIEILVNQLAWSRRQQQITQLLESTTEELRQLNWYKHRRLEQIQRTTALLLGQMYDLGVPTNELTQTRYQLLLRQLDHITASMTGLLKLEQWRLHINNETMPIASLLKRSLERVDNLLKQHKLWVGVHGLGQSVVDQELANSSSFLQGIQTSGYPSSMVIVGDIVKFELVLHELLIFACHRSQERGRIDIWCRRIDERSLEVSLTDNGIIEPKLLAALHHEQPKDVLAPFILNQPPGLHLLICQNLMQQLGGELYFYQLPDHRLVSRLLLPLAGNKSEIPKNC